jgi:mRNA interferase MazF
VVTRGEVWLARLDPTEGREIQKTRPCLVVSPPEIHDFLDVAIVAPMTTGSGPTPYRVELMFNDKQNRILSDQIRTVDKKRLLRRLGAVDHKTMSAVLGTLRGMFSE